MKAWLLLVLNVLVSLGVLWLAKAYGQLSWWWIRLCRKEEALRAGGHSFLAVGDQLYLLAVALGLLNLVSATVLSRAFPEAGRWWRVLSLAMAALALLCAAASVV
jgi:hypothetical protein